MMSQVRVNATYMFSLFSFISDDAHGGPHGRPVYTRTTSEKQRSLHALVFVVVYIYEFTSIPTTD